MKTIEVTDEMYASLMDISKEMTTQDNRCTAMPYFFQVRETKEIAAHEGCGDEVLYSSEHDMELRNEEEKIDFLKEHIDSFMGSFRDDELSDLSNLDEYTLDSILCEDSFDKFYVQDSHEYGNCFFTSKACDKHIEINGHNLHKPTNYLNHAFRNPEMELVSTFLCELSGGKMHT